MPELKNPKHERFAQLLAEGRTQVDSYEEAGYTRNDGNAAKTANRKDVQARVKEITGKGAELAACTVASLLRECEEARVKALNEKTPQCSAAVSATMAKAKISGLLTEEPQTSNNTPVNITSDNEVARRIGYIMTRGFERLQMKQIEGKVEEEGK